MIKAILLFPLENPDPHSAAHLWHGPVRRPSLLDGLDSEGRDEGQQVRVGRISLVKEGDTSPTNGDHSSCQ